MAEKRVIHESITKMYHISSNKNGVLYFRYVLPKSVFHHFPKLQKTYNRSLATCYRRDAKNKAAVLYARIHSALTNAMSIVDKHLSDLATLDDFLKSKFVNEEEQQRIKEGIATVRGQLEWLQERKLLDDLKKSDSNQAFEIYDQNKKVYDRAEEELEKIIAAQKHQEVLERLANAENVPIPIKTASTVNNEESSCILLSEVIDRYCNEQNKGGNWTEKTNDENRASYNLFKEFVGDKDFAALTRQDARNYKDILLNLPKNRNKIQGYRNKKISELVKLDTPESQKLSIRSVNKNLTKLSSLFAWAKRQGYCAENIAEKMTIKQAIKASEERDKFTDTDLKLIFGDGIYTRKEYKHSYYYWLPLLALYTGARLNELCQLYKTDIYDIDNVCVIDINKNTADKRLKNMNSQRIVPIHRHLIKLGFIDFAATLTTDRIFPELTNIRDGYGTAAGKWFQRFKKRLNMADKKAFHSFRHTFADALKQAKVDESIAAALLGHQMNGISYGRYGKNYEPKTVQNAVNKISFDLPSL